MNSPHDEHIHYLTINDLYVINEAVTGRVPVVRDKRLLRSAAARPMMVLFGVPQFPSIPEKAAALLHSLAYHHLFADGNKRTAAIATATFLERNGLCLTWDERTAHRYILEVAQGKHEIEDIALMLSGYTEPES